MSDEPDPNGTDEPLSDGEMRAMVVGLAILVEGGLIGVGWLLGWLSDVPAMGRFRLDLSGLGWGLAATVPMLACFLIAARWPVGPVRSIKRFTDETIRPLMMPCSLIDLAGVSLLAGVGEEVMFRGFLQEAFAGPLPLWAAVAGSAVLFGLLHAVTPSYAVFAALLGAYLGLVFHYSDNLLSAIVAHALYDFVALAWVTRGPGAQEEAEEKEG